MKKILILAYEYPPNGGGAGVVARQLYNDSRDYDYIEFIRSAESSSKTQRLVLPFFLNYNLFKKINFDDYSKIILNDLEMIIAAGKYFNKSTLGKTTVIIHGTAYKRYIDALSTLDFLRGFGRSFTRVLFNCSEIFCVSNFIKSKIKEDFPEFSNKIYVSYCGLNDFYFNNENKLSENKKDKFSLLSVSRIESKKGYQRKLLIFRRLIELGVNIHWNIIGSGGYFESLRKQVQEFDLGKHITLHGWVEREKISEFYQTSDLFWLLPIQEEAFGLVYIEAQSYGLSTIGSCIGGIPEAVCPDTGLISNDDNVILDFIRNYSITHEEIRMNIEFSNNFKSSIFLSALVGSFDGK